MVFLSCYSGMARSNLLLGLELSHCSINVYAWPPRYLSRTNPHLVVADPHMTTQNYPLSQALLNLPLVKAYNLGF